MERFTMKLNYRFALAAIALFMMALAPSAANAAPHGAGHMHSLLFHDRSPHVHSHGSHPHHS
jgi:hypothetical protein